MEGYNPIKPSFDGTSERYVVETMQALHEMRWLMPEFMGTQQEAEILGKWIWEQVDQRPLAEIHGLEGKALGEKVYEVRCGRCHVLGGYNDKMPKIREDGWELEDLEEVVTEGYEKGMPSFEEPESERAALLEYLAPHLEQGGE